MRSLTTNGIEVNRRNKESEIKPNEGRESISRKEFLKVAGSIMVSFFISPGILDFSGMNTSSDGFYMWRRKSKSEILLNDPISMKYRDLFVNKLREQKKGVWNVLIVEIGKGELFEWRDGIAYHPASTIKVPIAISVMKSIKELYAQEIIKVGILPVLQEKGVDNRTFEQLLSAMLVNSDEAATESCVNFVNTIKPIDRFFEDFFMNETKYLPRRSSQRDLFSCWENLFLGKLLDKDSTSFLLNLLEQYTKNDDTLLGVIRKKIPGIRLWNKRGAVLTSDLYTLQDTGVLKIFNKLFYLGFAGISTPSSQTTLEDMSLFILELCTLFVSYMDEIKQSDERFISRM